MPKRILIVCDGESWFVRRVAYNVENWTRGEMIYHCDKHIGGPFKSLSGAVAATRKAVKPRRKATSR
jgi:hypothetical protein